MTDDAYVGAKDVSERLVYGLLLNCGAMKVSEIVHTLFAKELNSVTSYRRVELSSRCKKLVRLRLRSLRNLGLVVPLTPGRIGNKGYGNGAVWAAVGDGYDD